MGDRTSAEYLIPVGLKPLVQALRDIGNYIFDFDDITYDECGEFIELTMYEANGGEVNQFERWCSNLRIPYDHTWGSGFEFSSGSRQVRWKDGVCHEVEMDEHTQGLVDGNKILELLDQSPGAVRDYVKSELERQNGFESIFKVKAPDVHELLALAVAAKDNENISALIELNRPLENFHSRELGKTLLEISVEAGGPEILISELECLVASENTIINKHKEDSFAL